MLEVLEFIFSSPARFGGTALLLMIISRWNLVKVVQKSDASIIEKLARSAIRPSQRKNNSSTANEEKDA
jgi:hypothetical protein